MTHAFHDLSAARNTRPSATAEKVGIGRRAVAMLGTRGIPARYGGFETAVERLSLALVQRGWEVDVYCQTRKPEPPSIWNGVRLFPLIGRGRGAVSTIDFDWKATLHSLRHDRIPLIFGYNTALFSALYRLKGRPSIMNMDGIEWRRDRWSRPVKAWYYLNERMGCLFSNHLIADHPEIARHLATRVPGAKISIIPYGADAILSADESVLQTFGVAPKAFALSVGRVVPENSTLEIVRAWSQGGFATPLILLGNINGGRDPYHKAVRDAAGPNVRFAGAVYDKAALSALRFYARFHIHGHTVGGTNPSLVEALGAGSPIVAHDNPFNRWVAGPRASFFRDTASLQQACAALIQAPNAQLDTLSLASRLQHARHFRWDDIIDSYEQMLLQWVRA